MSLPDRAQRRLVRSDRSRYRSGARRGLRPHTFARLTRAAVAAAMLSAAALGCVSLKPVLLDRKTQLENQVLGSFQRLEPELTEGD